MTPPPVKLGPLTLPPGGPLFLIAGPCVIEDERMPFSIATELRDLCTSLGVPFVFKASFDKANRTRGSSFRGPGVKEGLALLAEVRRSVGVPVLTDIHEPAHAEAAAGQVDCVQVPALLSRQTDLLVAAARTGRCVNVKKGQFLSPEEMSNVVAKLKEAGCSNFALTERGTFFGYNRLVNDITAIPKMQRLAPVIFDATHSCQLPGGAGTMSAGQREFVPTLAAAAIAAGADGLFMEVHDDPDRAKSDPATVFPLDQLQVLLERLLRIRDAARLE